MRYEASMKGGAWERRDRWEFLDRTGDVHASMKGGAWERRDAARPLRSADR